MKLSMWVAMAMAVAAPSASLKAAGFFEVTPAYSNAVMHVLLPEFSDFVRKMRLPVELPLTTNSFSRFACADRTGDVAGGIWLTNGSFILFEQGHVSLYQTGVRQNSSNEVFRLAF
jgi:hypothetical protein